MRLWQVLKEIDEGSESWYKCKDSDRIIKCINGTFWSKYKDHFPRVAYFTIFQESITKEWEKLE